MEKKEYIERDKLIKWLRSCKNACIEVCKGLNNNIEKQAAEEAIAAYDDCIGYAESVPAADVVEVVHGEWDESRYPFCNVCPQCGLVIDRTCIKMNSGKLNYCSNCGAKMDGGTNDR